jgi:hypothetical protein
MAALTKVRSLGVSALPRLLRIASTTVRTDLDVAQGALLFKLFATADLAHAKRTVFGPRAYATGVAGGSFSLRLDVCRAWIAANFPPIRPDGTWTPAP